MGNKTSDATSPKLHRYIMGGLLLLIIGVGTWLSLEARNQADENIRREMLRQAGSVASGLSMENMRDLSFRAEDAERPAFQRITRQLQAYAQTAGIRSLYTMSLRDGQLFFGPESLLPDDPYASPPGTLYQEPSPCDFELFRTGESLVYGPGSDEYGEFISALVPVVDPLSGKVLLVVGMDMEASAWRKKLNQAQQIPLWSTLSILSLLLLGYLVHGVYKRSPNMRVEHLRNIAISTYFAIMLLLTVIAFTCVRDAEHRTEQDLFRAEANAKSQYFTEATEQIDLVLHLLIGFFEASENIDREEFSAFCRHIFEGYPIESCYWIPAWSATDASTFTARIQAEGLPEFSIRRFADDSRPVLDSADPIYPAVYVEPASRLSATLGYDFYSHPVLRETLVETLRSGSDHACMVSASTPNSGEPSGFFVFVPISHPRQGGLVCFSINLEALIKGSDPSRENPAIASTLFELKPGKKSQTLSCSSCDQCDVICDQCDAMLEAGLSTKAPLFAFGNTYMMLFTAEPTWFASNPQRAAWWILGIGLMLALLLTYTAALQINRPHLLAKQVIKRTRELAESKERFDIAISAAEMGVWEHDLMDDRFIWNDRMLEIYGIRKGEFEGDYAKWPHYIHPEDHNHFMRELTAAERGEKDFSAVVRIIRGDGEIRHIRAFGKMVREENRTPMRMIGVNLDITDEIDQERKFRMLFEHMHSGAAIYEAVDDGQDFVFLDINESGLLLGKIQREDVIGKRVTEVFPGVKDMGLFEVLQRVWRTGSPEDLPQARYVDNQIDEWLENHIFKLSSGQIVAIYNNITERKQSQQALEESRQLLCNIIDSLPERVWWKDLDSRYMGCNIHVAHDAGFDHPDQLIGKTDFDMCWAVHAEAFIANDREVIESGIPRLCDPELQVLEDGSTRWIEVSMIPLKDTTGKVFGTLGTYADITERKQAEQSLARSEAKYRDLFEKSADACLIIKEGRFVDCNHAATEMLRCENKKQVVNMHPAELSPELQPDGSLSLKQANEIMQRMKIEKTLRFEWVHKRADGELFPAEVSLTSITDSEGSHIIHTMWRDITERKQAEEKLVRLSAAIEQSPESIVITDPNGDIQYINPAFENITGYTADEALGQNPRILKSGEQPPSFYVEMWETLSHGEVWEGRITNKRKNGTLFTEEATISPVKNANGLTVNYVAVKRDISGEIAKEEELRHAQKMEAVGELAGGVAHDFNNILQGIIGFSELLRYSLDEASQEYENATEIHKSATRAAKLTQQLLTFSRKQAVRLEEIDLNNAVYDSEALLHVLLGDQHELMLDLPEELPPAYADQSQLTQIIVNLAVNARDAMPEGGRLSISTECILINEADAAYIAGARPGRHLCLAVTDTGSGMDAETINRIFEPFFTTKQVGAGTGLGLAVIYGIVTQNRGWINVYSEIGKGSCFKVYLPAAESNEETAVVDPATGKQGRNARILLIEDDPVILNMVKKILGEADLTIIAAGSAEEGLELFDQYADGFDLLMSDMELPGMRGDELAEALRIKDSELPVLLFSGYRDQVHRWKNIAEKGYVFLNKPFTITILLDTVRNILKDAKGTHG